MRNKLSLTKVKCKHGTIGIEFEVTGKWEKFFTNERIFNIEYGVDIENIPESIAVIPFLCLILPVAWLCDADIYVTTCDEDFYKSIEDFKSGYRKMYPMFEFKGDLKVKNLQKNIVHNQQGACMFFSGGVDAYHTLISHIREKPMLITLWGADILLEDQIGWDTVKSNLEETAKTFEVPYVTVKSFFRSILNEGLLSDLIKASGDGWWHGFQHGIGIISHAAPLIYMFKYEKVYLASSFTSKECGKITCASDPSIDNYVRFCGAKVVHDGYECDRQMKIHNITEYAKEKQKSIHLRVCWEKSGGGNCCNCEKCWRTILGIYAEKSNPELFGFSYGDLASLANTIHRNKHLLKYHRDSRYGAMLDTLKKNYSKETIESNLLWLYETEIDQLGECTFSEVLLRKLKSFRKKVKNRFTKKEDYND